MPRIREVQHVARVAEQLALLPGELSGPLYEQLHGFRGRELQDGEHVELLLVAGRAVRLNLFVDRDGTLWIEALAISR